VEKTVREKSIQLNQLPWLIKTHVLKTWIKIVDDWGLFSYLRWCRERDVLPKNLPSNGPMISVVIDKVSARTQASLDAQTYPNWEQVADLDAVAGDWVIFLSVGDMLSPTAFAEAISWLETHPRTDILYMDEDRLDENGHRHSPFCKPDFSPDLLLSCNYLRGAFWRREHLQFHHIKSKSGGELLLRCVEDAHEITHLPRILYHAATESAPDGLNLTPDDLTAHLMRTGLSNPTAEVLPQGIRYAWDCSFSLVSIIIPSKDKVEYLRRCIESIQRITDYPRYEIIIVDNDSHNLSTLDYYAHLPAGVRLLKNHDAFNYSAYNNRGARVARGDLLLFLNNDVEIIEPGWMLEMVRWAERPEVGIVGAKLLYPDGLLQHAGIVIGMEGHGSHVFGGMSEEVTGPWGTPNWYRDLSAVTGACMMIRRQVFDQIGGFDESYLLVFNDIEICVRAREHGYRIVYNPFVRLIHHEGKSRGFYIPKQDIQLGFEHLKKWVANGDPYYNPNLSYSVKWPTLRRRYEPNPLQQLTTIMMSQSE